MGLSHDILGYLINFDIENNKLLGPNNWLPNKNFDFQKLILIGRKKIVTVWKVMDLSHDIMSFLLKLSFFIFFWVSWISLTSHQVKLFFFQKSNYIDWRKKYFYLIILIEEKKTFFSLSSSNCISMLLKKRYHAIMVFLLQL